MVVLAALVLTPSEQRLAVLAGIAEVIRAARGKDTAPPTPEIPAAQARAIEQNGDPVAGPHEC